MSHVDCDMIVAGGENFLKNFKSFFSSQIIYFRVKVIFKKIFHKSAYNYDND